MTEPDKDWDDLRRIADELELKVHLAGMDARARWKALRPRVIAVERIAARTRDRATKVMAEELSSLGEALRALRDEIARTGER